MCACVLLCSLPIPLKPRNPAASPAVIRTWFFRSFRKVRTFRRSFAALLGGFICVCILYLFSVRVFVASSLCEGGDKHRPFFPYRIHSIPPPNESVRLLLYPRAHQRVRLSVFAVINKLISRSQVVEGSKDCLPGCSNTQNMTFIHLQGVRRVC